MNPSAAFPTVDSGTASISFVVSERMVQRFAALTGDRSSLHVSDEFARRSAYRRPVVHGMLPLALLPLLPPLRAPGVRSRLVSLSGRFLSPVFVGDALRLSVQPADASGNGECHFIYRIESSATSAVVTSGTVAVIHDRALSAPIRGGCGIGRAEGESCMVGDDLTLNDARLEGIEPSARDRFGFSIGNAAIREYYTLLEEAEQSGDGAAAVGERFAVPELLAVLLFSPSVGMSLPGASATFLEFEARLAGPIEPGIRYWLEGTVTHRSLSTRIVRKAISVRPVEEGAPVLTGRAAALVNRPPRGMPTVQELKGAMDWGLRDKVVLITGASRGIGETTAKLFALAGAKVVVNYHRGAADAARVTNEIMEHGGEAIAVGADVTDRAQVQALVDRAVARFGTIDVLVNNAARDFRPVPFLELTWDEVQQDLDVVAKGAFLCCQQVIPHMLRRGGGRIINISSVATDDPPANQSKYVIAKSALVGLTRSLSVELAPRNIAVNLVAPSFVETDLVAHVPDGFRKKIADGTPMRRLASPVEVAHAVLFLASALSSFTTGQKLMVTGGGAPYA